MEIKSLFLAGELLEMTGKAKKGEGIQLAKSILDSGKAFEKFKEIIKAQGGALKKLKLAKFQKNIFSRSAGKIYEINNDEINFLARLCGCPADKSTGLYIYSHVGKRIRKNEKLLTIYSNSKTRLKEALEFYKNKKPIRIR